MTFNVRYTRSAYYCLGLILAILVLLVLCNEIFRQERQSIYYHLADTYHKENKQPHSLSLPPPPPFQPYNSEKTQTVHMVCLTNNDKPPLPFRSYGKWHVGDSEYIFPPRKCVAAQKIITVYQNADEPLKNSGMFFGFDVKFAPISQLPQDYRIIENETAYFLGANQHFEPANFYHYTKQIYFPLYALIKNTNQLQKGASNVAFFKGAYAVCPALGKYVYHDIIRYRVFYDSIHVKNTIEISAFNDKPNPHKVCYKNAVFSKGLFLPQASLAIDHFKRTLEINDKCFPNLLIIIERSTYRKILNLDQLRRVGHNLGYDALSVPFEKFTWKEQTQLVHCAKILVGVAGAGIQWAFFMKNHSGVVEIGWPQYDWPLFFSGDGGYKKYSKYNSREKDVIRPLTFVPLTEVQCIPNPAAVKHYYWDMFYMTPNFTQDEVSIIVKDPRNYDFWGSEPNVGKLCDIKVDKNAFKMALLDAGRNLHKT